ncbi:uncharacterized protein STEHIDRAFT_116266 [Stereum hirsutum FP-91666 SS1]|uniref:Uncharacterized protein n=1 Tax=Stereum hirsutum (strain FP-91666) TaxID=721885 RepID=R7RY98_STEHR|nr:uncharacterized protein STEHIDRAFT_116266 [Stereum hirsutum FP-91666 SS1]EIM79783.1 hypothetical protein STEHIDRAFT_116266 [Stereum hirsutum FP-91666 SS1]
MYVAIGRAGPRGICVMMTTVDEDGVKDAKADSDKDEASEVVEEKDDSDEQVKLDQEAKDRYDGREFLCWPSKLVKNRRSSESAKIIYNEHAIGKDFLWNDPINCLRKARRYHAGRTSPLSQNRSAVSVADFLIASVFRGPEFIMGQPCLFCLSIDTFFRFE